MTLLERLTARSVQDGGCRLWAGAKSTAGYGQVRHEGRTQYVHRLAYQVLVGPLVHGMEIDHLCRRRACWEPTHLEQVIHADNVRRGEGGWPDVARRRSAATLQARAAASTHCINGHERTPENTYTYAYGRKCKKCLRENERKRRATA